MWQAWVRLKRWTLAIIESGGTVGDVEDRCPSWKPRADELEVGPQLHRFRFLTYVPFITAAGELKINLLSTPCKSCVKSAFQ